MDTYEATDINNELSIDTEILMEIEYSPIILTEDSDEYKQCKLLLQSSSFK